ncbi:MAG: hypothetical protein JST53_04550 [Actinobacteria bacterium]|nr:hypothetical protein [Actinomycetota bacterium]
MRSGTGGDRRRATGRAHRRGDPPSRRGLGRSRPRLPTEGASRLVAALELEEAAAEAVTEAFLGVGHGPGPEAHFVLDDHGDLPELIASIA